MRRTKQIQAFLMASIFFVASTSAQSIDLSWRTIAGGGGSMSSTDGVIELQCTIGESLAGSMSAGAIELSCGFWLGMPVGCVLAGDLDGDGDVDLPDLTGLLSHFGATSGADASDGDSDNDGDVDLTDLTALLSNFGSTCM